MKTPPAVIPPLPGFDSHAHFPPEADSGALLARARAAGLTGLLAVGGDEALNRTAVAAAEAAPGYVFSAVGFDRSNTALSPDDAERILRPRLSGDAVKAVGEIGLDYFYETSETERAAQRALFERQVALAAEHSLPVVVHSREADADTLAVLRAAGSPALRACGRLGVLHCFVGGAAFAEAVLELGLCVSFSGIVTFHSADALRAVVPLVPEDRLLAETDCPYLAPVPLRGLANEPAYLPYTLRRLADLRGADPDALARTTDRNARRLFGL